ncbi:MAG: GTPase [Lachnospiraceae bacterium]|nr:GTPase [Lachnospiraceae bacterium]
MDATPLFIINGFLESGKTTFITETMKEPQFAKAGKVLILMCEEGEVEYDEVALAKKNVSILTVEKLSSLTKQFMQQLEDFYHPDMIMVELNGMWKTEDFLNIELPDNWAMGQIITLIDAETFNNYYNNMRSFFAENVKYSDVVIVNRVDETTDKLFIRRCIKPLNRQAQIMYETAEGIDDSAVEEVLPFDINSDPIVIEDDDFGLWYMDALDNPSKYDKKKVRFKGMVYYNDKLPKGCFIPGRMAMNCCAEDLAFIGFLAKPPKNMKLTDLLLRGWYMIDAEIKVEFARQYRGKGPVLYATAITPDHEPDEKVVYFT